jgi:hypothetical protein
MTDRDVWKLENRVVVITGSSRGKMRCVQAGQSLVEPGQLSQLGRPKSRTIPFTH